MSGPFAALPRPLRTRRARWVAGFAAIAAALAIAGIVWNQVAPEPKGPPSSSYSTVPAGVAAWAELLERRGRRVLRLREEPAEARLDPGSTVVAVDPGTLPGDDRRALARFVRAGGRLVAAGRGSHGLARELLQAPPEAADEGPRDGRPLAPLPEAAGRMETAGTGAWSSPGEALPAIGGDEGTLLLVARPGRGTLALLADASPLQNRLLVRADNAAVALALAPAARPVVFVESVHGYGRATGLAALPGRWKWLLGGLALAALAYVLSRARRFGPPEDPERRLAPPRRLYVEALSGSLVRTRDPVGAAAPVRAAARRLVLQRAALAGDARPEELRAAAARLGLGEEEIRAVTGEDTSRQGVLAAGRALVHLRGGPR